MKSEGAGVRIRIIKDIWGCATRTHKKGDVIWARKVSSGFQTSKVLVFHEECELVGR